MFKFKFIASILTIFFILSMCYNKFVLPTIMETAEKHAVSAVNYEINSVYNSLIEEQNITQEDFFSEYSVGNNYHSNTNTIVVNKLCSMLADKISQNLSKGTSSSVKVPLGLFFGNNLLSDLGPELEMNISGVGDARVDYDSSFKSVGVNQVNYKLWLDVSCRISITSPIIKKDIEVKRKVPVIDMIYHGDIPNVYLKK